MAKTPFWKRKLDWSGNGDFAGDWAEEDDTDNSPETMRDYEEPNPSSIKNILPEGDSKTPLVKRKIDWSGVNFSSGFGSKTAEAANNEPKKTAEAAEPSWEPPAPETKSEPSKSTSSDVTKTVKTGAGDYPVYKKASENAKAFASAFSKARKAGLKKFMWEGRSYTTQLG